MIYLAEGNDETLSVIDGNQRIRALTRYLSGDYALKGLTTFPELVGHTFSDLDVRWQRHIQNRTLRCITILRGTHPQVKFDVFERLNTGSMPLSAQELRHGIYYGSLMARLDELADSGRFLPRLRRRMREQELMIRFLAFRDRLDMYRKPLQTFLNLYCEEHKHAGPDYLETAVNDLTHCLDLAYSIYGAHPFAAKGNGVDAPINAALYDAVMVAVHQNRDALHASSNEVLSSLREMTKQELAKNKDFANAVTRATSDEQAVNYRISRLSSLFRTAG